MQCNIDSKGKSIRLISGAVVALAGLTVLGLAVCGVMTGRWVWGLAAVCVWVGAFQIWEGQSGWCVLRAMGFKTRV